MPPSPDYPAGTLGHRREQLGLTQDQIAERIGTVQETVSRWESGVQRPRTYQTELAITEAYEFEDHEETVLVLARTKAWATARLSGRSSWNMQTLADLLLHGRVSRLTPLAA